MFDVWNPELMCYVIALRYDFIHHRGTIAFPDNSYCDMGGCIALFTRIDPEVKFIQTSAGQSLDMGYMRKATGEWIAFSPPSAASETGAIARDGRI